MDGKKKKTLKIMKCCLCILFSLTIVCSIPKGTTTQAATDISQLEQKLKDLKKQADKLATTLSNAQKKKASEQEYKKTLDKQISNIQSQMDVLNEQIFTLDQSINEKTAAISEKQKNIDTNVEQLKSRLRAIYMSGELSELDYVFSADNVTEYLYRFELLNNVAQNDKKLINELKTQKASIESELSEIQTEREKVADARKDYETQKAKLASMEAESARIIASLSNQITDTKSSQKSLQAQYDKVNAEITEWYRKYAAEQKEQGKSQGFVGGTFLWPMPGYSSKSNISAYFGDGRNHQGIDIAGGSIYGASIVAANSGTVAYATNSNTAVYGKYLIIDHGGGISTLYGHCSNVLVSAGQKVTKGQVIAKVGSSGVATGPHLHFGVLINGVATDPMKYFTLK